MSGDLNITKYSYEEWASFGYQVIKGSKSTNRSKLGIALFTEDQVKPKGSKNYLGDSGNYEWEKDLDSCFELGGW